jgi:multiple sugar transport system permease protein/sn-glycerol 3-phosphate transport system permease protein
LSARGRRRREGLTFLAFAGPNLILFSLFTYWPVIYSTYLSLTDWNLIAAKPTFVGLANYSELFTNTESWRVAGNTLIYALCVVVSAQMIAFALALLLNRPMPARTLFRTLAFTPYVTTTAAAALAWVLLLDPRLGPLSSVYRTLGIEGPDLLRSGAGSLAAIIIVGSWKEIGFATVFFIAGLQLIDRSLHESASLEGAGPWAQIRFITIPLLTPVIFFLGLAGFIAALKAFDSVYMMTEGGPVYPDSSTYVFHLYKTAFRDFRAGLASAFAVIFFVLTVLITGAQFRLARRWVHYE